VSAGVVRAQSGPRENQTAVIQAEREWNDAYVQRDFAKLKAIMADDYVHANDDGTFDTRASNLRSTKSGEQKFTALSVSNLTTRVYGDIAINTGTLHMELAFRGVPSGGDFLFTDVWQRRAGRWQMIASAETPTENQQKKDAEKPKLTAAAEFKTAAEVYRRYPKPQTDFHGAIVNAEKELTGAWVGKERGKLESLLGDDLTDVWEVGFINNKRQDITDAVDAGDSLFESIPFGYVVRTHGDFAIFIGTWHNRGRYKGHDFDENVNELDLWHREGVGWKLLATHSVMCAKQPGQHPIAQREQR